MSVEPAEFCVGIVGGGLVGALEACLMAARGFKVILFEGRHDGRQEQSYYGRSINLALSHRGISALKRLDFDGFVLEQAVPMEGRMIHNKDKSLNIIPYDPDSRCIYSIERSVLNNYLLNKAEQDFNVDIKFKHKLVDMNVEKGELMFRLTSGQKLHTYKVDLILGCDGARSTVRSLLAQQCQFELNQTFIDHGYLELRIDPGQCGFYKMKPNYLHIWPRGEYMMIALPNKDASFTCTLFMPYNIFGQLQNPHLLNENLHFFKQNFPDALELIGAENIESTLSKMRLSSLISIKSKPYYYKNKVALLGDAAHAMVPFYGQGMNCGFEDCLVLDELFCEYFGWRGHVNLPMLETVLERYSQQRCLNGHSMNELAMYNYIEMRDLVNNWSFLLRKRLDNLLYKMLPTKWIPLYTMVTFSRISIDECVKRREKQDKILSGVCKFISVHIVLGCAFLIARKLRQ